MRYEVLVDSGADLCFFDLELAEIIGLDPKKGDKIFFVGVTGTQRVAYVHDIEINVGGHAVKTKAAFAALPSQGYGIVGQRGFFEFFRVIFDYQKKQVELRDKTVTQARMKKAA